MNQDFIFIDGQKINSKNLDTFSINWQGDPAIPNFLRSWWDGNEHIKAFTSGSTGQPKLINLKKKYARNSALATINHLNIKKRETALLSMPAHYIAGRMMLVRSMVGQLNLIPVKVSSEPIIPKKEIALAAFTPHQFQGVIQSAGSSHYRNIKNILLGGSPVSNELIEKTEDYSGRIFETFGMTETYSHIALRLCYPKKESFFHAIGSATFTTKENRLVIHAPHIGIQSLVTNDMVELNGSTQFKWLGRSDNVINSGGIKLHPEIIESKLAKVLKSTFFVTGKPDKVFGESLVLVIEKGDNSLTKVHVSELINQILDQYEKPKSIVWVDDIIRTNTGKINREETKKYYKI